MPMACKHASLLQTAASSRRGGLARLHPSLRGLVAHVRSHQANGQITGLSSIQHSMLPAWRQLSTHLTWKTAPSVKAASLS